VQGLANQLTQATVVTFPLTGPLTPAAQTLTATAPLLTDLTLFLATQAASKRCCCCYS